MDHAEAVRTEAVERYLLGELDGELRDRYEEHFFGCHECAEDVKAGASFMENARQVLAAQREAAAGPGPRRAPWRGLFWPLPMGAAAALVLALGLVSYQSLVVVPGLRDELSAVESPQAAPWHFLSISRAEPQVILVAKGHRMVGLTLSRSSDRSFPLYRCEVRDAGGRAVQAAIVPGPPAGEELQLLLPVRPLPPGPYQIILSGLDSPTGPAVAAELARYHFTLRLGEE